MTRISTFAIFALILAAHASSAFADENRVGLEVELVPEVSHIQPGTPFRVGLFIRHEPGYHTYWKEPGIVGVPTTLQWDLPRGWKGSALEYPEPERVLMHTIKAQGYEREVLLEAVLVPPARLAPGTSVTLKGRAVWMCCAKSCHPGFKDVSLTLPVRAEAASADALWQPRFEKERAARAQPSQAWTARATLLNEQQIELILTPTSEQATRLTEKLAAQVIYFTGDGWIDSDDPHLITLDSPNNTLRLLLPISKGHRGKRPPRTLTSLVQLPTGWENNGRPRTLLVECPLQRSR
jgi:thiol:disulfide interchange protein DsbD